MTPPPPLAASAAVSTRFASRLSLLAAVIAHGEGGFADRVERALSLSARLLGFEIGLMSRVDGDRYTVEACHAPEADIEAGDVFDLGDTFCSLTIEADDLLVVDDIEDSAYRSHPCRYVFGFASHLGIPIRVRGEVWGTLSFSSSAPRAKPLKEADLDLVRLLGIWISGVLEGKDRERQIRELDARAQTILDEAPIVLFGLDADGVFTIAEGAGLRPLGVDSTDLVGQNAFELYGHVETSCAAFRAVLDGETRTWEADVDGVVYTNQAEPTYDPDGRVSGLIGVAIDVTEQTRSEQQRKREADRLHRFLNVSSEPGTFDEHVARVLGAAADLLGLDTGRLVKVDGSRALCVASSAPQVEAFAPGAERPLASTHDARPAASGEVETVPDHARTPTTRPEAVEDTAYIGAPVDVEGTSYGVVSFSSATPTARSFTDSDRQFVRLVAGWMGQRVGRHLRAQQLADSEVRFRALSEATFEGVAYSEDGVITDANEQFAWLFGYATVDSVVGEPVLSFCAPEYADTVREMNGQSHPDAYEIVCVRRDGSRFWAEIQGRPASVEGRPVRITAIRDVTARKQAEEHRRFQADVLSHVSDAVVALDIEGRITYWNAGAERLHGHATAAVLGRPLDEVVHYLVPEAGGSGALEIASPEEALQSEVAANGELIYINPEGERRFVSVSSSIIRGDSGAEQGLLAVVRDVTAQRQLSARLRHQATHDTLTGLPNRALFRSRIESSLATSTPFAVLFIDLDHFKVVNDSLGHDAGDHLLTSVSLRLRDALGAIEGALVARLGGDEFGVFVPTTGIDVEALGQSVLEALGTPVSLGSRSITPSASVGIVAAGETYGSPEDLLRDADTAMYAAKHGGRQRLAMFTPAMHETATLRFGLEHDLKHATERGQLRFALQPIVRLADGGVAGFEVLTRWEHPEYGLLPPERFLPIAEEIGAIVELDLWVTEEACRTLGPWLTEHGLCLSVNVSVQTFLASDLVRRLAEATAAAGMPPGALVIELTERAFVDTEAAVAAAQAVQAAGFRLAVDDFGTGYSSLGLLHRLPVDILKIARSFVEGLGADRTADAIVRSVVQLARSLDLDVIAEGVQTPDQLSALREIAMPLAQGHLLSEPIASEAVPDLVARPPWTAHWEDGAASA
ncbi:MAG: EAL domain-containing protein [Bacteroidota bacterium]